MGGLDGLTLFQETAMDVAGEGTLRRLEALTVRGVVALEASDVVVSTELLRIVHADAFHGDGELTHLLEVDHIAVLHVVLDGVEEFTQHQPDV